MATALERGNDLIGVTKILAFKYNGVTFRCTIGMIVRINRKQTCVVSILPSSFNVYRPTLCEKSLKDIAIKILNFQKKPDDAHTRSASRLPNLSDTHDDAEIQLITCTPKIIENENIKILCLLFDPELTHCLCVKDNHNSGGCCDLLTTSRCERNETVCFHARNGMFYGEMSSSDDDYTRLTIKPRENLVDCNTTDNYCGMLVTDLPKIPEDGSPPQLKIYGMVIEVVKNRRDTVIEVIPVQTILQALSERFEIRLSLNDVYSIGLCPQNNS